MKNIKKYRKLMEVGRRMDLLELEKEEIYSQESKLTSKEVATRLKSYRKNFLMLYAERIRACANFVDNKDYGFVSKYKGQDYFVREGIFNGFWCKDNFWRLKTNNKIEQINAEYEAIEKMIVDIRNLLTIMPLKTSGVSKSSGLEIEALDFEDSEVLSGQINCDIQRIFRTCLRKGFQGAAIQLVSLMARNMIDQDREMSIEECLIEIEKNYARKKVYNDKGGYLQTRGFFDKRHMDFEVEKIMLDTKRSLETSDGYLFKMLDGNEFGTDKEFRLVLSKVYSETVASMQGAVRVREYAKIADLSK
ncbi:MAG: hypothetical protein E7375_03455 [Clostridiales bacterium]|nr:hypothetical protein [Clostridiales bacterium]